jgi:phasin
MADLPQFEIPEAMRDMAERNVEQARSAYNQFLDMARQSQDLVSKSSDTMAQSAREIQAKAMRYAEQNMEANFAFVGDLAKARDLRDYMDIQSRHAQRQMQIYSEQAQELGRMIADVAQKVQRG